MKILFLILIINFAYFFKLLPAESEDMPTKISNLEKKKNRITEELNSLEAQIRLRVESIERLGKSLGIKMEKEKLEEIEKLHKDAEIIEEELHELSEDTSISKLTSLVDLYESMIKKLIDISNEREQLGEYNKAAGAYLTILKWKSNISEMHRKILKYYNKIGESEKEEFLLGEEERFRYEAPKLYEKSANLFYSAGKYDEAYTKYLDSAELYKKLNNTEKVNSMRNNAEEARKKLVSETHRATK